MTQETSSSSSRAQASSAPKTRRKQGQKAEASSSPLQEEKGNTTADVNVSFNQQAESLHNSLAQQSHALFAENVKLSKDFFTCKTVNDLFNLQARIIHLNSTAYLQSLLQLSGSLCPAATDAKKENNG